MRLTHLNLTTTKRVLVFLGVLLLIGIGYFLYSFKTENLPNVPGIHALQSWELPYTDPMSCGGTFQGAPTSVYKIDLSSPDVIFTGPDIPRIIAPSTSLYLIGTEFISNYPTIGGAAFLYESNGNIHWGTSLNGLRCRVLSRENPPNSMSPILTKVGLVYQASDRIQLDPFLDKGVISGILDPGNLHFMASSSDYLLDSKQVYFLKVDIAWDNTLLSITPLPNSDPATFKILRDDNISGGIKLVKDKNGVYLGASLQSGINPGQFVQTFFANVFQDGNVYYKIGAGINQLVPHFYDSFAYQQIPVAGSDGIIASSSDGTNATTPYTKDVNGVYYRTQQVDGTNTISKIVGADPRSIVLIVGLFGFIYQSNQYGNVDYEYAKDTTHVYYQGRVVIGADPATFKTIENGAWSQSYGEDAQHVFYKNVLISGADPVTFKILWSQGKEGCGQALYTKDASHVYFETSVVPDADPATFEALVGDDSYGKDKRGIYLRTQFQSNLPLDFSPVCSYG